MDLFFPDVDGHFRQTCTLRKGKRVDRLEVAVVRIVEGLVDFGHGEAIVDHDVDMVVPDLDGLIIGALRGQRSSGPPSRDHPEQQQGHHCYRGGDPSSHGVTSFVRVVPSSGFL